jgi:hypothetical protein
MINNLRSRLKLFVFPFLILLNLTVFVLVSRLILKSDVKPKTNKSSQLKIIVFDPISYFFVEELTRSPNKISDITYVNNADVKNKKSTSFFSKNKIITSDSVFVIDIDDSFKSTFKIPEYKIKTIHNVWSALQSYGNINTKYHIKSIDDFYYYGIYGRYDNIYTIMQYIYESLLKIDPDHAPIYQENYLHLSYQVTSDISKLSLKINNIAPKSSQLLTIGIQNSEYLRNVGFKNFIDVFIDQQNTLDEYALVNIKNIISSGVIKCVANFNALQYTKISKQIKNFCTENNIKYFEIDTYHNFSFDTYLRLIDNIEECLTK